MQEKEFFSHFSKPGAIETDGGKGFNLKQLTQQGVNVPEGFVLHADVYRDHYPAPLDFAYDKDEQLEEQCRSLRQKVLNTPLPADCRDQLHLLLESFGGAARFAVRSSSTFEDLAGAAFAGQHDTYLNVVATEVEAHIAKCLASLWQKHAVLYRHHHGFDQYRASMAVVIQRMIPGDVAGVAFSIDPVSGHPHLTLVEANWGLGESVVGGEAITDSWLVRTESGEIIERRVAEKEFKDVAMERGVERVALVGAERTAPCLSDDRILAVAGQAQALFKLYGAPQDMEWVIEGDILYVVQSRPQTTIPPRFTRDESAERFPDPVTPLTWSYIQDAFNHSLDYSLELMNLHLPTRPWFELINHYVYGNQNAVELLSLHRPIRAGNFVELLEELPTLHHRYRWVMDLPQRWMSALDRYLLRLGELRGRDLENLDCEGFQRYFVELFELARDYFRPNIAISMTQAFLTNTLSGIIQLLAGDPLAAHDLFKKIIAVPETKTGQINRELFGMATLVKGSASLTTLLGRGGKAALAGLPDHPEFADRFCRFIDDYGHREIHVDYYHPTWAEAPDVVLDLILLTAGAEDRYDPWLKERELRQVQQQATRQLFTNTPAELHYFLQELIRLTLNFTFLDDLEHFQTTRLNLLARRAAGCFGRKLQRANPLEDPYDIFFLTRREVETIRDFHLGDEQLWLIGERKRAFVQAGRQAPAWNLDETDVETDPGEGVLSGIPGSPGECRGTVYLVHGPQDFSGVPPGAVLVARTTNPAWTPLFYKARAVVTESGGPLSHGAVTARELGIPAVLSVRGCMTSLINGEQVVVNGRRGTITRLGAEG